MLRYIQILLFSIFLLIGLFSGFNSLKGLYLSKQASSWEITNGTINDVSFSRFSTPKQASVSSRNLEYSYFVGERKFTGNKEYFGISVATNKQSTGDYNKGQSVKVFYDPAEPSLSVLKPIYTKNIWFGFLLAIIFIVFGGLGLLKLAKK